MNFLGHSYFKGSSSLFLVGNICGDFYKGLPEKLSLPEDMVEGIKFHRKLDRITDSTKAVARAKSRLSEYGRYSGIIVDIYYDHFLAVNWNTLHNCPLETYSEEIYSEIMKASHYIPSKSEGVISHMIEENWLINYRDLNFIHKTLKRISKRISRENSIDLSIYNLKDDYEFFQNNFLEFWSELNSSIK